jgi:hypothetical protein
MGKFIFAHLTPINGWKFNENFGCYHSLVHMMGDTMMQQYTYVCAPLKLTSNQFYLLSHDSYP